MINSWKKTGKMLGEGGQARVFVVRDTAAEMPGLWALKVLKNENRTTRLNLEISTMRELAQKGAAVIKVVDSYDINSAEKPWFVMELATNGSLAGAIESGQSFGGSEIAALEMFSRVVKAVKSLHLHEVAHRDLKPANILLHNKDVILCDLGLCLPLMLPLGEQRLTGELERIGSIHYMPKEAFGPQQINRNQYALDAYALGKILYELLSGRVLPGYVSPTYGEFDLHARTGKPLFAALNSLLKGLLHDDPQRRLSALEVLSLRIDGLIDWAKEDGQEINVVAIRDRLAIASASLGRAVEVVPVSTPDAMKEECDEIAKEISAVLIDHSAVGDLERILVGEYPDALDLQRVLQSNHLRGLLVGPFTLTHRGMEPFEDVGYPMWPVAESGGAIGVVPKGEASKIIPQQWLGCLVAISADKIAISIGCAHRDAGINGYSDLVQSSVRVFSGLLGDPKIVQDALSYAKTCPIQFVDTVAHVFSKLISK